ncbi:hypothetical protein GCM10009850_112440 [Nonomuraea monospora]|uniref:Uncharacterized protein n=1 Tax=Nonomuraea monospora TaxID=568818 RepID=A0ABP5PVM2_9ACTN
MDDLENRLATLLGEAGAGDPPPGLADRIHRSVSVRRRNRRAAWLAGVSGVTAVLVAAPLTLRGGDGETAATVAPEPTVTVVPEPRPTVTMTITGSPRPSGRPTPTRTITVPPGRRPDTRAFEERLRTVVAVTSLATIGARMASGERFTPAAIGSDGTVLGLTPGGKAAQAPASGGTPEGAGFLAQAGLGAADGLRTWTQGGEQHCRTADGATRTISPQGADPEAPVWVDGGVIVGSDVMGQPWVATGCAKPGTTLKDGTAVAFSYPYLFTVEPANARKLRMVDVRTLKVAAELPLPEGVRPQTMGKPLQKWYAAATGTAFAWVAGGVLHSGSSGDWRRSTRTFGAVPKQLKGDRPRMTAGDRLVVYTTGSFSLVHDPRTGVTLKRPGLVLASGPWLLWQENDGYRLARVQ